MELLWNTIPILEEHHISARELANEDTFLEYGVADTSILKAAGQPCLILTDDFRLSGYVDKLVLDILNFHQIKHGS